jgi:hypothetical protein
MKSLCNGCTGAGSVYRPLMTAGGMDKIKMI